VNERDKEPELEIKVTSTEIDTDSDEWDEEQEGASVQLFRGLLLYGLSYYKREPVSLLSCFAKRKCYSAGSQPPIS
jgi:hypothetical protein